MTEFSTNDFITTLQGKKTAKPPVWFMRQAGRYLPEYRALRETAADFMHCVMTPDLATEITLQPILRYPLIDAAILFSDILVIPHALGQKVDIIKGSGVQLGALPDLQDLHYNAASLDPVLQAVKQIRGTLSKDKTLIGFAGAPWTIACYMISGNSHNDFMEAKTWAFSSPEKLDQLIEIITDATIDYLCNQIESGANVIQLFESWAGALAGHEEEFQRFIISPTVKIVAALKAKYPSIPVIGFPRCSGNLLLPFVEHTKIDAVSLDWGVDLQWANDILPKDFPVQGNLDPVLLLVGGEKMIAAAKRIMTQLSDRPFIFNLGHGVIRFTPTEHVETLLQAIKS